jgi:hypothetical protein
MSEELKLTEEEIRLILNRRKLLERRVERRSAPQNPVNAVSAPQPPKEQKEDVILGKNRPPGWDSHTEPERIHKGRLTEGHPMHWFETNVFKKISNMRHQAEHKKIMKLLGMPVQTQSKDRVYHALCHLDVLWTEGNLPVSYKHRYEAFKAEQGIGDDNIHPAHKKPGVVYKTPKNKRPWNPDDYKDYDKDEVFVGDRNG